MVLFMYTNLILVEPINSSSLRLVFIKVCVLGHSIKETNYEKVVDTLVKSLFEIANKSSDPVKIQKANNLLKASICLYMRYVLRNNLLDNCGCSQQGRHNF